MGFVSRYGDAVIRRIYGDWTRKALSGWKETAREYGFRLVQASLHMPQRIHFSSQRTMLGLSSSMGTRTDKGRCFSFLTFLSVTIGPCMVPTRHGGIPRLKCRTHDGWRTSLCCIQQGNIHFQNYSNSIIRINDKKSRQNQTSLKRHREICFKIADFSQTSLEEEIM